MSVNTVPSHRDIWLKDNSSEAVVVLSVPMFTFISSLREVSSSSMSDGLCGLRGLHREDKTRRHGVLSLEVVKPVMSDACQILLCRSFLAGDSGTVWPHELISAQRMKCSVTL